MKKILTLTVAAALSASVLAGCASSGEESASSESSSSVSSEASSGSENASTSSVSGSSSADYEIITGDFTPGECVSLPEYKGLELTETIYVASEAYVEQYVQSLADTEEVTDADAEVENGDVVNISYEGTLDGVAFDGGTSDSYDLTIGSDTFIDGFEDGLIGMKAGDETDLNLTFPESYSSTELAGQDVVFHVTVNSISRYVEQDDAWVSEYTSGDYTTMDEFSAYIEEMLNESLASNSEATLNSDAWSEVYDNTQFLKIPEDYLTAGRELFMNVTESEAQTYGYDTVEEYFEAAGLSDEDIDSYQEDYAVNYAETRIFAEAILEAEGISTDGEEVNAQYEALADSSGVTLDEFIETYGEERVYVYGICAVANDIIVDNANVTEVTEEYDV